MTPRRDALPYRLLQIAKRCELVSWLEPRLSRGLAIARADLVFRGCDTGPRVAATGRIDVVNKGSVRIGARTTFLGGLIRSELVCAKGASIHIGARTMFNYGVSLRACNSITIGDDCMFGSFTVIRDHDGQGCAPIVIGDNVWVAHGAVIEPGVTIGSGSVISARAVVGKDIPECSLAIGNPAVAMSLRMARA